MTSEEAVKRLTAWVTDPVTGANPIAPAICTILAALAPAEEVEG